VTALNALVVNGVIALVASLGLVATDAADAGPPGKPKGGPPWASAPESARQRANPYASRPDAVRAGRKLFTRHCASCHGQDAKGGNAPPLATGIVRGATDGELFWTLTNGHLREGMPSWSQLPEPRRWQIVSFLKSHDPAVKR